MTAHIRTTVVSFALMALASSTGCVSRYFTPGGPAPIGAMTTASVAAVLQTVPESPMPARVAYAHIQDRSYRSASTSGVARGTIALVSADDLEKAADLEAMRRWPETTDFVRLTPILVRNGAAAQDFDALTALREGAATLHADILALYTVDTHFRVDDFSPGALGVLTLGLAPTRTAVVHSTVSIVFVDVRTGFVYGTAEASSNDDQLANSWTSGDAVDQCRRRVEREAFEKLLVEAGKTWEGLAAQRRAQLTSQGLTTP